LPLPLSPTLFPYTTLFRSFAGQTLPVRRPCVAQVVLAVKDRGARADVHTIQMRQVVEHLLVVLVTKPLLVVVRIENWMVGRKLLDRKSTRLNSSHLGISYA